MKSSRPVNGSCRGMIAAAACAALAGFAATSAGAQDVSSPAILQYFESSYSAIEGRLADVHAAGYGSMYTPPPGRSETGNTSVGYDQYDRFDLGSPGNPTTYGTETGLRTLVGGAHSVGLNYGIDLVWNQSGFGDMNTGSGAFYNAGGYPGFNLKLDPGNAASQGYNDTNGDYHASSDTGDQQMRLAGLVDIAQEKNYQMIRSPVTAGDPNNIRAGSIAYNGRIANVPDPNNARFYPDKQLQPIYVYDPTTGEQNIPIYPFNNVTPMAGDAVEENATGYLMRNTQWLVQSVGIDMFRIDATKNYPSWVLNYYDRAVYRASQRPYLDGSQRNVFAFGEYYDGNFGALQSVVRKDINPAQPGTVGGNRDTLDFPLFFAMRDHLTGSGFNNDWNQIVNASFDANDDGYNNGSQGVKFVSSPDNDGPYLNSVAYAYTLMMPGNALVYFNPQQFGTNRSGPPYYFPKTGRGDALGGLYGNAITTLVDLRNRYGRGNYLPRLVENNGTAKNFAFEREKSALVLLSAEPVAGGFDERTFNTSFQQGQFLIELTGNASSATADPNNNISKVLTVGANGSVTVRFLHNATSAGTFTGKGYLVYGLPTPQGALTFTGIASTLAGGTVNTSGMTADQIAYANATTRLASVPVFTGGSFNITLGTSKVNLLNNPNFRDHDADGDNALLKIDDGFDANSNGTVDFRTPGGVTYGFEQFATVHQDGYTSVDNNGTYTQTVNATNLSEGYHYVTARAFRHRTDGGPAVFTDFRKTIYVDRLPPVSAVNSNVSFDGNSADRDFNVRSTDKTATSVHTFLNLPAGTTDAQILAMVNGNNNSTQTDRDLFKRGFFGIASGNNVLTAVTYEITGNYSIQRFPGINLTTSVGAGLGDLDHDGTYTTGDVSNTTGCFEQVLYSQNAQFNPAGDLNGDGKIDNLDLYLLQNRYNSVGATAAAAEARAATLRRGNINHTGGTDAADIDNLFTKIGTTGDLWYDDLNVDGLVSKADIDTLVHTIFQSEYGDANLDSSVDTIDFNILAANFSHNGGWANGDFSGDGSVDTIDFNLQASNFGFHYTGDALSSPSALGSTVPEPATLGSILVFATSLGLRRRKN